MQALTGIPSGAIIPSPSRGGIGSAVYGEQFNKEAQMQMTVGKKIILGFGSLIALLAIIGITTTIMVTKTGTITEQTLNIRYPTLHKSTMVMKDLEQSLAALRGYMLMGGELYKQQRSEAISMMRKDNKELERINTNG